MSRAVSLVDARRADRRFLLALLACVLMPLAGGAADPVDTLRRALSLEGGANLEAQLRRRKQIESAIPELTSISQLRQAYFLKEWLVQLDADKNKDLLGFRTRIGTELTKAIRRAAQAAELDQKLAVAILIAELGEADPSEEAKEKFVRILTPIVLDLTKDASPAVRQAGFHALGRMTPRPAEALPPIRAALKGDELGPRRLAAYALVELVNPKNLKAHLERTERMEMIEKVTSAATVALDDSDEWIRGYSLQAILDSAAALKEHVLTPTEELTIEKKGEKAVLRPDLQAVLRTFQAANPQLQQALQDPKVKVRLAAVQTLVQLSNARAKILKDLGDRAEGKGDVLKQFEAPDPLGKIIDRDWSQVARLLREDDVRLRRGAIEFLELLGANVAPVIEEITLALRDSDPFVRWAAARTIRHLEPRNVPTGTVRALGQAVLDPDADVSRACAQTLEDLGAYAAPAVEFLAVVIGNGDPDHRSWDAETRIGAMRALIAIGPGRTGGAIPRLIEVLTDPDPRIRRTAAETLGRFGPAAGAALPALRQALRDEDSEVRLNASEAILNITVPPARKAL